MAPTLTQGLEGQVTAGLRLNGASVSIEGPNTLLLLSQAGFSAGTAGGTPFEIVADTQDQLVANFFDEDSMNTFVLNKRRPPNIPTRLTKSRDRT